ncbi:unnamed protein product [Amoebophrya sp. A25]|nr:unnamed protein product [Amoebophrya sp. A25]|eukprot:GSA25T00003043001.1
MPRDQETMASRCWVNPYLDTPSPDLPMLTDDQLEDAVNNYARTLTSRLCEANGSSSIYSGGPGVGLALFWATGDLKSAQYFFTNERGSSWADDEDKRKDARPVAVGGGQATALFYTTVILHWIYMHHKSNPRRLRRSAGDHGGRGSPSHSGNSKSKKEKKSSKNSIGGQTEDDELSPPGVAGVEKKRKSSRRTSRKDVEENNVNFSGDEAGRSGAEEDGKLCRHHEGNNGSTRDRDSGRGSGSLLAALNKQSQSRGNKGGGNKDMAKSINKKSKQDNNDDVMEGLKNMLHGKKAKLLPGGASSTSTSRQQQEVDDQHRGTGTTSSNINDPNRSRSTFSGDGGALVVPLNLNGVVSYSQQEQSLQQEQQDRRQTVNFAEKSFDTFMSCEAVLTDALRRLLVINTSKCKSDEWLYGRAGLLFALVYIRRQFDDLGPWYTKRLEQELRNEVNTRIRAVVEEIYHQGLHYAERCVDDGTGFVGDLPRLCYEWHGKRYLGGAHGLAGIYCIMLQAKEFLTVAELRHIRESIDWLRAFGCDQGTGNYTSRIGSMQSHLVQFCHGAPGFIPLFLEASVTFGEKRTITVERVQHKAGHPSPDEMRAMEGTALNEYGNVMGGTELLVRTNNQIQNEEDSKDTGAGRGGDQQPSIVNPSILLPPVEAEDGGSTASSPQMESAGPSSPLRGVSRGGARALNRAGPLFSSSKAAAPVDASEDLVAGSRIHQIDPQREYYREALRLGEVLWKNGVLKKNASLCHGLSGNGFCFLALYRATSDDMWLRRAHVFARLIQEKHAANEWEHPPDRPYSLFEGMAGELMFFNALRDPKNSKFPMYEL